MTERSLDEFVTENGGAEAEMEAAEPAEPVEPVEASAPTMRWSGAGAPCAGCGDTVTRRWRDDGSFVCADCKDW
ncbi:DUF7573 domain-containing protein [Haloplanus salilacus]|uniref:DUF7573 domain-containing protein n=1 Tax=Haloplanus salilacus TaxID=2949994 RepID=UPI0030D16C3A